MASTSPVVLKHARLATMNKTGEPYGLIENGAVAVEGGKIAWCGKLEDLPAAFEKWASVYLEGRLITPGLIDCHTHIVHGGSRANEFEMRLNGASYEDVARAGGGIVSTVRATRSATDDDLLFTALPRVDALLDEGVTAIEVKSGYGLDIETELAMLSTARAIALARRVRVRTSFLGAHAVPPEYAGRPDAYIDEVCLPALEAVHSANLADAVDGFCEGIAFTPEQIRRVFTRAQELGIPVKLHAEQLSNLGGTKLAAQFGALSVDHVEYAGDDDAMELARAGSVAVLLPGAFYTLRETKVPPVAAFRAHQVPMAVATDCNPGTSPLTSLLLAMNMACTLFRLTPEEALAGTTVNAAKALGLTDAGRIAPGLRADLAVWNVEQPAELAYRIGFNPLHQRFFGDGA